MNDEDIEVLESEQEQQPERTPQRRETVSEKLDNVRDTIRQTGETMETVGKGEQKVADWIQGSKPVEDAVQKTSDATTSTAKTTAGATKNALKTQKAATEAAQKGVKTKQKIDEATKTAGAVQKGVGEGLKAGAKGAKAIPYAGAGISAGMEAAGTSQTASGTAKTAAGSAGLAADKTANASLEGQKRALDAGIKGAESAEKAAETAKKANDLSKAASQGKKTFAEKLRENGKLNELQGKRLQELSNKFDSDAALDGVFDKLGSLGKVLKGIAKAFDPKVIAVLSLLLLIGGSILVTYILSPMFFMNVIKETALDPDRIEKAKNFISGLGYQNTQEAFYEEVDYLNEHYDDNLDFAYIMAALYHIDIYYEASEYNASDDIQKLCEKMDTSNDNVRMICTSLQVGYNMAHLYFKEATTTTGTDGLVYSQHKFFRLRELAKHQFLGEKKRVRRGIIEYIDDTKEQMDHELKNITDDLPAVALYLLVEILFPDYAGMVRSIYAEVEGFNALLNLIEGTENYKHMINMTGKDSLKAKDLALEDFKYLIQTIYNRFFNIKIELEAGNIECALLIYLKEEWGIGPGCDCDDDCSEKQDADCFQCPKVGGIRGIIDSIVKVVYYEYQYDEDKFEDYLVDEYIRYMPEFHKYIVDEKGKISEEKIMKMASEIRMTRDIFVDLYPDKSTAKEDSKCIGDVNLDLLEELTPPINLTMGQSIQFSGPNNYGLYKGIMHYGVDLESGTTGTKTSDPVYSIYDGEVLESTVDNTYSDEDVNGGWVVILYDVKYEDSNYGDSKLGKKMKQKSSEIKVIYGGLDSSSLTLKKGDKVEKGQQIGVVGSASASETGEKSSLHFGVFDVLSDTYLNPVNMFITCNKKGKGKRENGGGSGSAACDLSIHDAPSKEDFLSATQAYIESGGSFSGSLSNWDLNDTYNYSVNNGVNPELVVIRAMTEGFSPGSGKNNYWGIGCTNGCDSCCTAYSSFESGIAGFAGVVSGYDSISDFYSYAYIGDYWYNPGNSSDGGCYYYPFEKKYMSEARAKEVEEACSSDKVCNTDGSGDCLPTTDEDQEAHAAYNSEIMCGYFNNIYSSIH